jgi:hypothetical protein
MVVELGPFPADVVQRWTRFARRVLTEVRTEPSDLAGVATDDLLIQWSRLIDQWSEAASATSTFRWSLRLDSEVGEYLLHGLERCLLSPTVRSRVTAGEAAAQRPFTYHVVQAFVSGLESEGRPHEHYAEQVRATLRMPLVD